MRSTTSLAIPQPCTESWAAMSPITQGRHCAACAKTVVDFTLKTDAEILAYLAGAAVGRTCGRFAAGQLERPLQRAASAAPGGRWQAWLAAAVAVWGLREGMSLTTNAQVPMEMQRKKGKPFIDNTLEAKRKPDFEGLNGVSVLRGVVRDSVTNEGLPGVTVLIKNSTVGTATSHDGTFELALPDKHVEASVIVLQIKYLGYFNEERYLLAADETQPMEITLQPDNRMTGEVVITGGSHFRRPWPWRPRAVYYWGKYWLTRPFHRS